MRFGIALVPCQSIRGDLIRRRWPCALLALLALLALISLTSARPAVAGVCGSEGVQTGGVGTITCTWSAGAMDTFKVPADASRLKITAQGAPGQNGTEGREFGLGFDECVAYAGPGGSGGNGWKFVFFSGIVPSGGDASKAQDVREGDSLEIKVAAGGYTGGTGGSGETDPEAFDCHGVTEHAHGGSGGAGGGAAYVKDKENGSLAVVAAGGGGGGGGGGVLEGEGSTNGGEGGENGAGARGGTDGGAGGAIGSCTEKVLEQPLPVPHGCAGAHSWAGGGGGGGGAQGGGGGGAAVQGGGGGSGKNESPFSGSSPADAGEHGAFQGSNSFPISDTPGPALVQITWTLVNPTTTISLSPASPDGLNAWYVHPPKISVSATGEAQTFCDLDPATPPTNISDFAGLPVHHGPGCEGAELSAASADGVHTLYAMSEDAADATSAIVKKEWKVDSTAPTIFETVQSIGNQNPDGTYFGNVPVSACAEDPLPVPPHEPFEEQPPPGIASGLDASKTPGIELLGKVPEEGCLLQTLKFPSGTRYVNTTVTSTPVNFYDLAGNKATSKPVTVHFQGGPSDEVVLFGDCHATPSPCSTLATQAGGTVTLKGYVNMPLNDATSLSIDWGDGSAPSTASWPGEPGPPAGEGLLFEFQHTYANNPPGGSSFPITVTSTQPDSSSAAETTTTATVTHVPPTLALEPDCAPAICLTPPGSTLTVPDGQAVELSGQVSDPGSETGTVKIEWGDGSTPTTIPFGCGTPGQLCETPSQQSTFCGSVVFSVACGYFLEPHTYAHPGKYTISVLATDQEGASSPTLTSTATVTVPTVTNVSSTAANGTYGAGKVVPVTVSFSEPVNVTGTPQVALNSGGTASYTSGSGTSTLTFTYTVAAGQNANPLDEATANALTLNGGTIKDSVGSPATLTLPSPGTAGSLGANKTITIETTLPAVTSVSSTAKNGTYGTGAVVPVTVSFNLPVNVKGAPELQLNSGGTAPYTSGSGTNALTFTYTVAAGQNANPLDEATTSALTLNGGTIEDELGDPVTLTLPNPGAAGSLGANKAIKIDTQPAQLVLEHEPSGNNGWNTSSPVDEFVAAEERGGEGEPACLVDGAPVLLTPFFEPGFWMFTVSGDGIHEVECTVKNSLGNQGNASDIVKIADTPPLVSITKPTAAAVYTQGEAQEAQFECTEAPTGGTGGVPECEATLNGAKISNGESLTQNVGQMTLQVTARSEDGLESVEQVKYEVKEATGPIIPSISLSHTPNGLHGWNITTPVSESVTASKYEGEPVCTIGGLPVVPVAGAPGHWTLPVAGAGVHEVKCTVTSATSNEASASDTVKIATAHPVVTITRPTPGAVYTQGEAQEAQFECSEPAGGTGTVPECEGSLNDEEILNGESLTQNLGFMTLEVTARSEDGRETTQKVKYEVEEAGPIIPSVSLSHTPNGLHGWNTSTPVSESVTASEYEGEPECTIDGLPVVPVPGAPGHWTFPVAGAGVHEVLCFVYSATFNEAEASDTVKIATAQPVVTITRPTPGAVYTQGEAQEAQFECSEPAGGTGTVPECEGSLNDEAILNGESLTQNLGFMTLEVTARSEDGRETTEKVKYEVKEAAAVEECSMIKGNGHISPPGKAGENLREHLDTSLSGRQYFSTTPPHKQPGFVRLVKLQSASCTKTPTEALFTGSGTASMRTNKALTMSFAFRHANGHTYLTLDVLEGAKSIFSITEAELSRGSKQKIG